MQEREIPIQVMMIVLTQPDVIVPERKNRSAYQAEVEINGKPYIILFERLLSLLELSSRCIEPAK